MNPPPHAGWSRRAMVSFALILAGLTTVGVLGIVRRPALLTGFPDDPAVAAAREMLHDPGLVDAGGLRFESSLDAAGEGAVPERETREPSDRRPAPGRGLSPAPDPRLAVVAQRLAEARGRHLFDPRLVCLMGHVELAAQRLERAEGRYRTALVLAPHYGEARLGLGVTLARRAGIEGDERTARALSLEAIAQFAAVDEGERFHPAALYDRALMLARVGRTAEALRWARRYLEVDPSSAWAETLRRTLGTG